MSPHACSSRVHIHLPALSRNASDFLQWPIPDSASVRAQSEKDAERVARGEPARPIGRRPPGKKKYLWGEDQIELAKKMAIEGKTAREICAALGGISAASFYLQFPGGITAIIEQAATKTEDPSDANQ